ncbi:MAG: RpnC/YadD family protein [Saccharospirillum sp.]
MPVVVFLNSHGKEPRQLELGSERYTYLTFQYIRCSLADLRAEDYWDCDNLIARLCLRLMHWSQNQKLKVYAQAVRGLVSLEADPEKQLKYLDFIDIYTVLDDNEMQQYEQQYPQESKTMASLTERLRAEGMEKGIQQGMQQGMHQGVESMLRKQIRMKFGAMPAWADQQLAEASDAQLDEWVERILMSDSLEALLGKR